jgi:glycolate oxidase
METLLKDLSSIVGEERATDSMFERVLYSHDLAPIPPEVSMLFKILPDAVVRPKEPEEIAELIEYSRKKKIPLIPRGAASWAFGGVTPVKGGIVLDLTGMNKIEEIDKKGMKVTVEAGITWKRLLEELEKERFTLNVYPTSAPSATVGGWICTGGLGIGSLKYGHLREHVAEIEVVTPTGEITRISRQTSQGQSHQLDWFFGSEGTLGVITKATLHIRPKPEVTSPHAVCFYDAKDMCNAISKVLETPAKPYFIEFTDKEYLNIKESLNLFVPRANAYAIFVFEGSEKAVKEDEEHFYRVVKETGGNELDPEKAHEEWEERFYPMRIKRAGPTLLAGDVQVPIRRLYEVFTELWQLREKFTLTMGIEGSVVSRDSAILMPMFLADERKRLKYLTMMPVLKEINELALKVGGKPYGGFGIWNSFYLHRVLSDSKIREMKEHKKRLDPDNIMNPGKLYQTKTRFGVPFTWTVYRFFMFLLRTSRRIFG